MRTEEGQDCGKCSLYHICLGPWRSKSISNLNMPFSLKNRIFVFAQRTRENWRFVLQKATHTELFGAYSLIKLILYGASIPVGDGEKIICYFFLSLWYEVIPKNAANNEPLLSH
jgi:hypothetical protein